MSQGWICLHRQLLEWEWYNDINVCRLFLHCLLKANHKDKKWQGNVIPRGSFVTGRNVLADETGLTVQQIRTSLNKLKSTNDLTIKSTNKNSLVTVVNYGFYQDKEFESTNKTTSKPHNEQPTSNQRITTTNNVNNETMKTKDIDTNVSCENENRLSPRNVVDLYNSKFKGLFPRQMRELTPNRQTVIRARIKNDFKTIEEWSEFFDRLKTSDFLMGRVEPYGGRKVFQLSLDWICKPENLANILEGKYHG